METGEAQSWCPGDRCFCEELIFVPGPDGETQEDDGVLLGMVFDGEKMRTSLAVSVCTMLLCMMWPRWKFCRCLNA